ncbi:MAG: OB-fold domain-containing protein [Burkholderiales bacterium]|nr:MAG: OB-fold domain-containing protein [Burkholderiales bacterium]
MRASDVLRELRPLREGMFSFDDAGRPVALCGSRCENCGGVAFPARTVCDRCGPRGRLSSHRLSTHGRVYASTVIHVSSALGHAPPYAYGYVDLPEDGTRIFAPFVGADLHAFQPGVKVTLAFDEIPATALPDTLGYAFVMVSEDCADA